MISSQKQHGTICIIHEAPRKMACHLDSHSGPREEAKPLLSSERAENWPSVQVSALNTVLVSCSSTLLEPGPLEPGCVPESPLALRLSAMLCRGPPTPTGAQHRRHPLGRVPGLAVYTDTLSSLPLLYTLGLQSTSLLSRPTTFQVALCWEHEPKNPWHSSNWRNWTEHVVAGSVAFKDVLPRLRMCGI